MRQPLMDKYHPEMQHETWIQRFVHKPLAAMAPPLVVIGCAVAAIMHAGGLTELRDVPAHNTTSVGSSRALPGERPSPLRADRPSRHKVWTNASHQLAGSARKASRGDEKSAFSSSQLQQPPLLVDNVEPGTFDSITKVASEIGDVADAMASVEAAWDFFGFGSPETKHADADPRFVSSISFWMHQEHRWQEANEWYQRQRHQRASHVSHQFDDQLKESRSQLANVSHVLHGLRHSRGEIWDRFQDLRSRIRADSHNLRQEMLFGQLQAVSAGLQFWIDAHKKLHVSSSSWSARRADFLGAVKDMIPSLKESFLQLRDWIFGTMLISPTPPLLIHMAKTLNICETRAFTYAASLYAALFQAGLAYCEWKVLDSQTVAPCDAAWTLATLPALRRKIHAQAVQNFGLSQETTAQCFAANCGQQRRRHVSRCKLVVRSGYCLTEDGCASSPNFPFHYNDSGSCSLQATVGCELEVHEFSTEECCDHLYINGNSYSGIRSAIPKYLGIQDEKIFWSADYSDNDKGWRICLPWRGQHTSVSVSNAVLMAATPPWLLTKHICDAVAAPGTVQELAQQTLFEISTVTQHRTCYPRFFLAAWDKGSNNNCSGAGWPCLQTYNTDGLSDPRGMMPLSCVRSAVYAFSSSFRLAPSHEFLASSFDAVVPGGFPGDCRVSLNHGHQADAIACIKTLLQLICASVGTAFPCYYSFLFVHTNTSASHFSKVHIGHHLIRAEANWMVVVG